MPLSPSPPLRRAWPAPCRLLRAAHTRAAAKPNPSPLLPIPPETRVPRRVACSKTLELLRSSGPLTRPALVQRLPDLDCPLAHGVRNDPPTQAWKLSAATPVRALTPRMVKIEVLNRLVAQEHLAIMPPVRSVALGEVALADPGLEGEGKAGLRRKAEALRSAGESAGGKFLYASGEWMKEIWEALEGEGAKRVWSSHKHSVVWKGHAESPLRVELAAAKKLRQAREAPLPPTSEGGRREGAWYES